MIGITAGVMTFATAVIPFPIQSNSLSRPLSFFFFGCELGLFCGDGFGFGFSFDLDFALDLWRGSKLFVDGVWSLGNDRGCSRVPMRAKLSPREALFKDTVLDVGAPLCVAWAATSPAAASVAKMMTVLARRGAVNVGSSMVV